MSSFAPLDRDTERHLHGEVEPGRPTSEQKSSSSPVSRSSSRSRSKYRRWGVSPRGHRANRETWGLPPPPRRSSTRREELPARYLRGLLDSSRDPQVRRPRIPSSCVSGTTKAERRALRACTAPPGEADPERLAEASGLTKERVLSASSILAARRRAWTLRNRGTCRARWSGCRHQVPTLPRGRSAAEGCARFQEEAVDSALVSPLGARGAHDHRAAEWKSSDEPS